MKWLFLVAILFGTSAYLLDAFFAHGLKSFLGQAFSEAAQNALLTAVRYQLYSSLYLLLLTALYRSFPSTFVLLSGMVNVIGTIFFSGTVYLKYLYGFSTLSFLAPIGGISFVISLLLLVPIFSYL